MTELEQLLDMLERLLTEQKKANYYRRRIAEALEGDDNN